jgi:hypothetical protein
VLGVVDAARQLGTPTRPVGRGRVLLAVGIAGVIVVGVAAGVWQSRNTAPPVPAVVHAVRIPVPNVIGKNAYYASVALKNSGLCVASMTAKAIGKAGGGYPILRETPSAGVRVVRGTGVSLVMGEDAGITGGVPRTVGLCATP